MFLPLVYLAAGLCLLIGSGVFVYRWGVRSLTLIVPMTVVLAVAFLYFVKGLGTEFITLGVSPIVIGAVGGYSLKTNRSFQFFVLVASLPLALALTLNYYGLKVFKGMDLVKDSRDQIVTMVSESKLSDSEKEDFLKKVDGSVETLQTIIPFSYFLNSLFISMLGFALLKNVVQRFLGENNLDHKGIAFFKINDYLIFLMIAGWAVVLLVDKGRYSPLFTAGLNCALIFSVLYIIQAIGIVRYFLDKKGIPRYVLPIGLLLILIIGMQAVLFFSVMLMSIGAIDFWADFRKLEAQGKE